MTPVGAPDQWIDLIDTLVPDVLDLVVSTWGSMPSLPSDAREDPTTEELCRRLRQSRTSADLPFRIDIQMVELDPAAGEDQGRMDIAFSPPVPREDIYFCLECKRLNVVKNGAVRAYAAEYVTHGMLRFIRGRYAAMVRQGGMLAYVLDGNVPQAISNVGRALRKHCEELRMDKPGELLNSSIRPSDSMLRETRHTRSVATAGKFRIHHIFVSS